ncbi:uncharacterized protein LOC132552649 [Ylistrum balloti]|uniref:uncharacterized protein LOC132552649 n=1 Tax=Ylistrum balloti TaxID=509963 RepID=UPI0029059EF0|nr:uncharacterized protein LOC132552649 [Ylistrum balloti]
MKAAILLCLAFGAVLGQIPSPCNSPPQWEGREVRMDYSQKYEERRRLFYDQTNLRTRTIAEVEINSTREFYDVISLFKERKMYSLNMRTKTCNVTNIEPDRAFHYRGVHPDARFEGILSLGAAGFPGENIQVEVFSANETNDFYTGIVTSPGCIPVNNIHISQKYGYEHSDYFDITVGITDPQAFVPPTNFCDRSHVDMKTAVIFLSVVGAVFSQVPTPCESPRQWQARERVAEFGKNFEEYHKVYYDGSSGRERNIAEIEDGSDREFFDILSLFNENKRYMINMKTRQCNVSSINRPFRHRGVPPNAQFTNAFTLGSVALPGQGLSVQSFIANVTFGTFHEEYFGLVTSPGCVPINNYYYNPSEQTKSVVAYYDLTVGISDPMIFVPPPECM